MKQLTILCLALMTSLQVQAETIAIVNVNVIPMSSERVTAGQTVIVEDGIIRSIENVDAVAVPAGATVIDGTDRYLMPGLAEMHAHVTGTATSERLFKLFLANGVTTIRGMLGRPSHLELRTELATGRVTGPRLITSGPSFNGNSVSGADDGANKVREQHAAGYDFIKIHPGLTRDEFVAVADTANELGMPFAGHVPASVGLPLALDKGIATIDHLDGYMAALMPANFDASGGFGGFFGVMLAGQAVDSKIGELVSATVDAGVANVATESLFEQWVSAEPAADIGARPEMRYASESAVNQWIRTKNETVNERGFDPAVAARAIEIRRRLIREIHEAGGVLLLGSDAPQVFNVPGFSIHRELELMVAAGLTPYEALQTGTTAAAAFLGLDTGAVEVGRPADLVLLDANPLADITNSHRVHGTLVQGRWHKSRELLEQVGARE